MDINKEYLPQKKTARLAGLLTLLIAVIAIVSMVFLPTDLIVPGDAMRTAANIQASEGAFRISMVGDALIFLVEIILVVILFDLVKAVDKTLAAISSLARFGMTVIQGMNLINRFIVLSLVGGVGYLSVFAADQVNTLVMLFLDTHDYLVLIWGLSFGLHLLILGYLVYKSGYMPGYTGILLIVAGVCYLVQSFGNILLPQYEEIFTVIGFISMVELVFPIWLVIKGVRESA
jgi:hypothetical protein